MVSSLEKTIRLVIVDDHILFTEGTASLLSSEPCILVVGMAKDGRDCLTIVEAEQPDVVLLDIHLPDFTYPEGKGNNRIDCPRLT